jgi:hypothetical protein
LEVSITKDDTTIVDGAGKKADIQARIAQIKQLIDGHHLGLRQGEAARAVGKARWWRCRDQGRRCHRGRSEGEEGPRR